MQFASLFTPNIIILMWSLSLALPEVVILISPGEAGDQNVIKMTNIFISEISVIGVMSPMQTLININISDHNDTQSLWK